MRRGDSPCRSVRRAGCVLTLLLYIAAIVAVLWMLAGCGSQKTVTAAEVDSTLTVTDTTKLTAWMAGERWAVIDTGRFLRRGSSGGIVEFVDGGGTVTVDSAGNIALGGVAKISGGRYGSVDESKGMAAAGEFSAAQTARLNGLAVDSRSRSKRTAEKPDTGRPWYETVLIKVGEACLIVLIFLAVFLYIRRKW